VSKVEALREPRSRTGGHHELTRGDAGELVVLKAVHDLDRVTEIRLPLTTNVRGSRHVDERVRLNRPLSPGDDPNPWITLEVMTVARSTRPPKEPGRKGRRLRPIPPRGAAGQAPGASPYFQQVMESRKRRPYKPTDIYAAINSKLRKGQGATGDPHVLAVFVPWGPEPGAPVLTARQLAASPAGSPTATTKTSSGSSLSSEEAADAGSCPWPDEPVKFWLGRPDPARGPANAHDRGAGSSTWRTANSGSPIGGGPEVSDRSEWSATTLMHPPGQSSAPTIFESPD
jgi:hypothetical protein